MGKRLNSCFTYEDKRVPTVHVNRCPTPPWPLQESEIKPGPTTAPTLPWQTIKRLETPSLQTMWAERHSRGCWGTEKQETAQRFCMKPQFNARLLRDPIILI